MANDSNEVRPDAVDVDFELNGYDSVASADDGVEPEAPASYLNNATRGMGELGVSQSTLDRITALQNDLAVRLAEIDAIPAEKWDAVWASMQGKTIPGSSVYFYGWAFNREELRKVISKMLVTSSYTPDDVSIQGGETTVRDVGVEVQFFKSQVPDQAAAVTAEANRQRQAVEAITRPRSPEAVGWDTFVKEVEERASKLGDSITGGFSFLPVVLVGGGVVVAWFVWDRFSRSFRSNPPRRSMGRARRTRRRNPPSSGVSLKMVAAAAAVVGIAYAAYRYFFGAPSSSATAEVAKTIYALQQQATNLDATGLPAFKDQAASLRAQAAAIAAANPAAKALVQAALQSSGKA